MEIIELKEIKPRYVRRHEKSIALNRGTVQKIRIVCECGYVITTYEDEISSCMRFFESEVNAFKYSTHYGKGHEKLYYSLFSGKGIQ